jgi:formylglycine-generating enzyme required for sulfatase activity
LPARLTPLPGSRTVAYKGLSYQTRVGFTAADGLTVEFVLIPADAARGEPPFYILRTKVWVGLYSEVMGKAPADDPLAPVARVRVEDAARFAELLGGRLPTPRQWDRAVGLTGDANAAVPPLGPTVGVVPGPRRVTDPSDDVSAHGVRDLTSSGREWTRELTDGRPVPLAGPAANDLVVVRGRPCSLREPVTLKLLRDEAQTPQVQPYAQPADDLSFRVVIEVE